MKSRNIIVQNAIDRMACNGESKFKIGDIVGWEIAGWRKYCGKIVDVEVRPGSTSRYTLGPVRNPPNGYTSVSREAEYVHEGSMTKIR